MPNLIFCFVLAVSIFATACTSSENPENKTENPKETYLSAMLNFAGNDLKWVPGRLGQPLPQPAIVGGVETTPGMNAGKTMYICRARWGNGMHPGKLLDGKCNIEYNGKEESANEYEVLTGTTFAWIGGPRRRGEIIFWDPSQKKSFQGGWENGQCLYICRGEPGRGWHPGKYLPNTKHCHFGYGGARNTDDIEEFQLFDVPGNTFTCNPNPTPTPTAPPPSPPTPPTPEPPDTSEGFLLIDFLSGTTENPGSFWLMNGRTGQTSGAYFTNFLPNQSKEACAKQLNEVAVSIGLSTRFQDAKVRIYRAGNTVKIDNPGYGPSVQLRCFSSSGQ